MRFRIKIKGVSPIIHHDRKMGLDTEHPAKIELADIIARKSGSKADKIRIRELKCYCSFWLNEEGAPTIPVSAIRAVIENGAKKFKEGGSVREGLVVEDVEAFDYDRERYGTDLEQLQKTCQFTVPVIVARAAILGTRARFDLPWSATFVLDCDDEIIDGDKLDRWLDMAGRRVGLGDWRPQKSGTFGRFQVATMEELS